MLLLVNKLQLKLLRLRQRLHLRQVLLLAVLLPPLLLLLLLSLALRRLQVAQRPVLLALHRQSWACCPSLNASMKT